MKCYQQALKCMQKGYMYQVIIHITFTFLSLPDADSLIMWLMSILPIISSRYRLIVAKPFKFMGHC